MKKDIKTLLPAVTENGYSPQHTSPNNRVFGEHYLGEHGFNILHP